MGKEFEGLEKEIKKFDWKEWTPLLGAYITPRNMSRGEHSQSVRGDMAFVNGMYHGLVSFVPVFYAISEIVDKYI